MCELLPSTAGARGTRKRRASLGGLVRLENYFTVVLLVSLIGDQAVFGETMGLAGGLGTVIGSLISKFAKKLFEIIDSAGTQLQRTNLMKTEHTTHMRLAQDQRYHFGGSVISTLLYFQGQTHL